MTIYAQFEKIQWYDLTLSERKQIFLHMYSHIGYMPIQDTNFDIAR